MQPNLEAPDLTALPYLVGKNKYNISHHRIECTCVSDGKINSATEKGALSRLAESQSLLVVFSAPPQKQGQCFLTEEAAGCR